ncbi:hypothetical protein JA9_000537 [Meyerozyma sp. JA9]|nr:hypothetical protein JA9_000537 [Meyerozyma sp. JA9]
MPPRKRSSDADSGKVLSCQRCRIRKVKCDLKIPCTNCKRLGVECERTSSDMRKKRPPASYVVSLERQVRLFTGFFEKFKSMDPEGRKAFLESNSLEEFLNETTEQAAMTPSPTHNGADTVENIDDPVPTRSVYGPMSVYDSDIASRHQRSVKKRETAMINAFNKDPDIIHCLKLFFTWQYPDHNMFVFREAFLIDFFNPKPASLYCSRVLVLSICSLGARMSDNDAIFKKSRKYYQEARDILLAQLEQPSITSLQSFLLLAFYDICNGSNASGWMLSGNAIRMGFDLGFQLNPEVWFVRSQSDLSPLDVAIRSRIYWGCYMADHFISLVLGRPSLLKISDATIPETDHLPDLEWIDDYMYRGPNDEGKPRKEMSKISGTLRNITSLTTISENMLNDIFTRTENDPDLSNNEDLNLASRLDKLSEYNYQIKNWKRKLPSDLQWDRRSLEATGEDPTLSTIRYYYYILVLCLNRPFVGIDVAMIEEHHLAPAVVCMEAIEDLYAAIRRFKQIHGTRRMSIFIVYCCILSISALLLINRDKHIVPKKRELLHFFMDILHDCSKTWKLAEKSYKLIRLKLGYEEESNPSANSHDSIAIPKVPSHKNLASVDSSVQPSSDVHITDDLGSLKPEAPSNIVSSTSVESYNSETQQPPINYNEDLGFFGGPPVLMTSDLFNEDWESLFPNDIYSKEI